MDKNKQDFLKKYNPTRSEVVAQSKAIAAAVQHNKLYSENIQLTAKKKIRATWVIELTKIADKYKKPRTVSEFEDDFLSMQNIMNANYLEYFRSGHKAGDGFRISHAQKSLSVYLKHLWCMGVIDTPPICPIDNVVLKLTEARGSDATWTFVNCLEEHRKKFRFVQQMAAKAGMSVAEWEIFNFSLNVPTSAAAKA